MIIQNIYISTKCSSFSFSFNDFWRSHDTEDWSNDAENSALHHRNKLHFTIYSQRKLILNYNNILQFYCTLSNKCSLFTLADDSLSVLAIQVSSFNDVVFGVHPVHTVTGVVNGKSIGPEEVRIRNYFAIRAVHVGIFNAWHISPVGPVNLPKDRALVIRNPLL